MATHEAQVELTLQNQPSRYGQARGSRGMTLIEVIGVLAVLAILAAIVLPVLIKQTDTVVANQEIATLQSFGKALRQNAARNRRIPGVAGNDWATNIAAELGLNIADVTNNIRRQPRVLAVDTAGFGSLSTNPPAYLQPGNGTQAPINSSFNPRLMIVSSLGAPLPPALVNANGLISTADFNNLWGWNPNTGNFPSSGVWSGWSGNPNDITVERVNLTDLFVELALNYGPMNYWSASYQIDTSPILGVAGASVAYFIQGSRLSLYYSSNNIPDSVQVLNQASSFTFNYNKWGLFPGPPAGSGGGGSSGSSGSGGSGGSGIKSFDFTDMVNGFLAAPSPTATAANLNPGSQQTNVVQNFVNYMQDYTNWANSNFTNNSLYNQAVTDQSTLMSNVNKLISTIVVH